MDRPNPPIHMHISNSDSSFELFPIPLRMVIVVLKKSLLGAVFGGQNSGIEKAFLFDVVSKIYIATDSSPVDMQTYELCCDMIDVVIDISCIYG